LYDRCLDEIASWRLRFAQREAVLPGLAVKDPHQNPGVLPTLTAKLPVEQRVSTRDSLLVQLQ
jgi:hypothetical protein